MSTPPPFTPEERRLFFFLSAATFFEGYDFIALTQILPELRADFGLSPGAGGLLVGAINVGTILAYWVVRKADTWGRARTLMLTIAGYTICSVLSGLAWDAWSFGIAQLLARIFLIGEWAVCLVYAAEVFPAARRGLAMGVIQATASLGAVVCAGVAPIMLHTALGWRLVYFVGAVPLILLMFARRNIKESARFEAAKREEQRPVLAIWSTPYRGRVLLIGLIWILSYIGTHSAMIFWKEFAVAERGFTDTMVGGSLTIAAVAAMPLVFGVGKLMDVVGRRRAAAIIFPVTALGVFGAFTLDGRWPLTAALVLVIFGVSGVLPVLEAFTAELFPTEMRGDGFAWANNVIGRLGLVAAPLAVGAAAGTCGWGTSVAATAIFPLLALARIWMSLPETNARELEDTAAL